MIIILDVLFVVLFILILEQSPSIKIVLPENVWLKDTVIVSEDEDKAIQHWFNMQSQRWEEFKDFPAKNRKFNFLIGRIACEESKFCLEVPSIGGTKKIYVEGNLYDQISGLISDSCLKFPKQCSNVTYHVKDDGNIDTKKLKDKHQFFRIILEGEKN